MRQGRVGIHVAHQDHQHEVRPRRAAVALLHLGGRHGLGLKGLQVLGTLAVQGQFHQGGQQRGEGGGVEDGDLALDDAHVLQCLDASQRSGS